MKTVRVGNVGSGFAGRYHVECLRRIYGVRVELAGVVESLQGLTRDGEPVLDDPVIRDQLVQLAMEEKALRLGEKRSRIPALSSDYPFSLNLSSKLRASEFQRRMRQFAVRAQGGHGSLYVGDPDAVAGGFWQRAYFNNFATTIGGGTSQIQSNIIGEHVLGLPKS